MRKVLEITNNFDVSKDNFEISMQQLDMISACINHALETIEF